MSRNTEEITGIVERISAWGIRIDGEWYNFSKFMEHEPPDIEPGDEVVLEVQGIWIMKVKATNQGG